MDRDVIGVRAGAQNGWRGDVGKKPPNLEKL
jgi:hypothetical protein